MNIEKVRATRTREAFVLIFTWFLFTCLKLNGNKQCFFVFCFFFLHPCTFLYIFSLTFFFTLITLPSIILLILTTIPIYSLTFFLKINCIFLRYYFGFYIFIQIWMVHLIKGLNLFIFISLQLHLLYKFKFLNLNFVQSIFFIYQESSTDK